MFTIYFSGSLRPAEEDPDLGISETGDSRSRRRSFWGQKRIFLFVAKGWLRLAAVPHFCCVPAPWGIRQVRGAEGVILRPVSPSPFGPRFSRGPSLHHPGGPWGPSDTKELYSSKSRPGPLRPVPEQTGTRQRVPFFSFPLPKRTFGASPEATSPSRFLLPPVLHRFPAGAASWAVRDLGVLGQREESMSPSRVQDSRGDPPPGPHALGLCVLSPTVQSTPTPMLCIEPAWTRRRQELQKDMFARKYKYGTFSPSPHPRV